MKLPSLWVLVPKSSEPIRLGKSAICLTKEEAELARARDELIVEYRPVSIEGGLSVVDLDAHLARPRSG